MSQVRIGIGYDLHRTVPDRPLRLGGVEVPAEFGLLGHSDADIVLHALCDALLGAAGLGDIGEWFPDTDPAFAGADSRELTAEVVARIRDDGWNVVNVDVIVHAQRPKLADHKARIRASLADQLAIAADHVNIKATTNEELDAVGRGEALAAWVAVLLEGGHAD